MKLLLTSGGVANESIRAALVELLGKPIEASSALVIPTASYPMATGAESAWRIVAGHAKTPLAELGWASLGILELTALPSLGEARWIDKVRAADALLVGGGDPFYLAYWLRESGLAALLPSLERTVWVGVSAGSLAVAADLDEEFGDWTPPVEAVGALGLVDFAIFPHVDHPALPENRMADAERWAARRRGPAYALDDDTAIKVVDGEIDVVSEGHWRRFAAPRSR